MVTPLPYVVALHGDYDVSSQERLVEALAPANDRPHVVVDFTNVRFLDSTALAVLIRMRKRRGQLGYPLVRFVGLHSGLRRVFEITHLDGVWPHYDTIQEALASFDTPASQ